MILCCMLIIVDSGSMFRLAANKNLCAGVQPSKTTLAMSTNAGTKVIRKEAYIPGYGKTWFDEHAIANIFALCDLHDKKNTRTSYDSDVEDAFIVTTNRNQVNEKTVKFERTPEGLYAYNPSTRYLAGVKHSEKRSPNPNAEDSDDELPPLSEYHPEDTDSESDDEDGAPLKNRRMKKEKQYRP